MSRSLNVFYIYACDSYTQQPRSAINWIGLDVGPTALHRRHGSWTTTGRKRITLSVIVLTQAGRVCRIMLTDL